MPFRRTPRGERFADRTDAGRQLAAALDGLNLHDPVVLALPRGGVPVAFEIARALEAPLDVVVVRKIPAPGRRELGVGAVAEDADPVLDASLLERLGLAAEDLGGAIAAERDEVDRRRRSYRGRRALPPLADRDVVVVDDGLATGGTARAALRGLRRHQPARLILAVPCGAPHSVESLRTDADEIVCLRTPADFGAVGRWYQRFDQTRDDEVIALLERSHHDPPADGDL